MLLQLWRMWPNHCPDQSQWNQVDAMKLTYVLYGNVSVLMKGGVIINQCTR